MITGAENILQMMTGEIRLHDVRNCATSRRDVTQDGQHRLLTIQHNKGFDRKIFSEGFEKPESVNNSRKNGDRKL